MVRRGCRLPDDLALRAAAGRSDLAIGVRIARTLLRASYARFAEELGFDVANLGAFPGIAVLDYRWNDANRNGIVEPSEIVVGRDNPSPR